MRTQEKEDRQIQTAPKQRKPLSLLIGLGLLAAIALFVGYNVTTLANQHIQRTGTTTMNTQTSKGSWEHVLDGFSITSMVAAPNNAAILYACAIPVQTITPTPYLPGTGIPVVSYALLHSTDGGTHWQEVTHLNGGCQIAINPTNSNDIYTIARSGHTASNGQVADVLKHSTDGGRSWTDIAPTLLSGSTQLATAWHVQQLSMVGNQLFGTQLFPTQGVQPLGRSLPPSIVTRLSITHLVGSSDGGHTWTLLDSNRDNTGQGTHNYVVSPSNPQTIYELAGTQWPAYLQPAVPKNIPLNGGNLTLYKTVDGGKTWTKLLENLPYSSKIQVAGDNASIVYVGSTIGATPLKGYDTGQDVVVLPQFSLQVSMNSGATWRTVKALAGVAFVQNWFVGTGGHVYVATGSAPHIQPVATTGTTVAPSVTAQIGQGGYNVGSSQGMGNVTAIQRYDIMNDTWSVATQTPPSSSLLAVTTDTSSHNSTLWVLSNASGEMTLYRQKAV